MLLSDEAQTIAALAPHKETYLSGLAGSHSSWLLLVERTISRHKDEEFHQLSSDSLFFFLSPCALSVSLLLDDTTDGSAASGC